MKNSNWQAREAARIGNEKSLETILDEAAQRRARAIRAENMRRTAKAAK